MLSGLTNNFSDVFVQKLVNTDDSVHIRKRDYKTHQFCHHYSVRFVISVTVLLA